MPIEIERKFLVTSDAWRAQAQRRQSLRQGYLSAEGGRASMRVRIQGEEARLNIKAAVVGSARAEFDYGIPLDEGREILASLCVGVLAKTRHFVEFDGLTWEVDEFEGRNAGLVVAELELDRVDQAFSRPPWLGREVTQDRRYYNHYLALHPYQSWPDAG
ncbi:MAG: CYTH domain-containing protein [Gammaproteobacteria bacterium]|jgi:adenylate cyclase